MNTPAEPAKIVCLLTGGPSYKYAGFYFEVHPQCGPCLLNKLTDHPTNKNPSAAFWRAWEAFDALPYEDKLQYEYHGHE